MWCALSTWRATQRRSLGGDNGAVAVLRLKAAGWAAPVGVDLGLDGIVPRRTGLMTVDALLAGNGQVFWNAINHLILPASLLGFHCWLHQPNDPQLYAGPAVAGVHYYRAGERADRASRSSGTMRFAISSLQLLTVWRWPTARCWKARGTD